MHEERTLPKYKFVDNLWDDTVADGLDPLGRLVYRSNLLGQSWRITNTGGGNTSSKLIEKDPISGEPVEVLWVKGSGGDLRTSKRANFASLYQDKLVHLQSIYDGFDERGPKTLAEDAMVQMYRHCTYNLNPRAPSIDTPLHSFVPFKFVDHTHPVACIAIATAQDGPGLTREIYGDEVIWTDWQRPGFELGLTLQGICRAYPEAKGVMLGGHGLINWAQDDKACYLLSLDLIEKATAFLAEYDTGQAVFGGARYHALSEADQHKTLVTVLPWLRGRLGQEKRLIATVEQDAAVQDFINSEHAGRLAELGTSCPDHFLRTKIKPLYIDWNPQQETVPTLLEKLEAGLGQYQEDYSAYYEACKRPDSPAMRGGNPSVILIPGIGMVAWGKSKSESRVTAEFYKCAVEVMRGAEAVSAYTALPRQEAFDIEYWALEEAKLRRMPPEQALARRIAVIVGAGSGIGRALIDRLLKEGAVVAALDLDGKAAAQAAAQIEAKIGKGIGVAGSGISGSGDVIGLGCNLTDRESIRKALHQTLLAYGGVDHLVVTAGLYPTPDAEGNILDARWADTFGVNVTGPYLAADETAQIWKAQGLTGSMVVTTSVNAVVPKKGSFAYDTSKAASNHLVRELAVALAPKIRINGVAPATVVEGSSMFPRERVMASLSKYNIDYNESESTTALRERLAGFYAKRTLTNQTISPADQAEAIYVLLGDTLSKTTGQILSVDGGLHEAFMR